MEDLLNQVSTELTQAPNELLWISKIDLEFAYCQSKLSDEISKLCSFAITGENINGYYRFKKGSYGLSDIPTKFQEKIDRALKYGTPVWLDDIKLVTRGAKMNTEKNCSKNRNNFKKPDTGLAKRKLNFFSKKPFGWNTR